MTNYKELSIMLTLRAMDQGLPLDLAANVAAEATARACSTGTLIEAVYGIKAVFEQHGLK